MLRRILFDLGAIAVVLLLPWWVALAYALIGITLFPWYLEAIFIGLFFDTFYGTPALAWYLKGLHTIIFTIPLGIGEYIKRRVNL